MNEEMDSGLLQDVRDLDNAPMLASPADGTDSGAMRPDQKKGDSDGTDTADSDSTDSGDSDGTDNGDADGTDESDGDGTDAADADGSDSDSDGTDH